MSKWQNRILGHGVMRAGDFLANPLNWRLHPKFQQGALTGVLDEVGWIDEVTINKRTGRVVDGHLRVTLGLRVSDDEPIPYREVDLSPEEEALILATKDPIAALAVTDSTQLDTLLREIRTGDAAIQQLLAEIGVDAEMAAAYAESNGATKSQRQMGDAKQQIKPVLYIDELAIFEEAIKRTGEQNRGAAIITVCRAYLDGHQEGQLNF